MANPIVSVSSWSRFTVTLLCLCQLVHGLASSPQRHTTVVTGANGYVGRAIIHSLLEEAEANSNANADADCQGDIVCLVRSQRVADEQAYWKAHQLLKKSSSTTSPSTNIRVLPYDMLDAGKSLREALQSTADGSNAASITLLPCLVQQTITNKRHWTMCREPKTW
jgi:hypothetical protein